MKGRNQTTVTLCIYLGIYTYVGRSFSSQTLYFYSLDYIHVAFELLRFSLGRKGRNTKESKKGTNFIAENKSINKDKKKKTETKSLLTSR